MPNLNNTKKNKQLTSADRAEIQDGLIRCMPFKAIAHLLKKNSTPKT